MNQLKKINIQYTFKDLRSPLERILEIFTNLKQEVKNKERIMELDWFLY